MFEQFSLYRNVFSSCLWTLLNMHESPPLCYRGIKHKPEMFLFSILYFMVTNYYSRFIALFASELGMGVETAIRREIVGFWE